MKGKLLALWYSTIQNKNYTQTGLAKQRCHVV